MENYENKELLKSLAKTSQASLHYYLPRCRPCMQGTRGPYLRPTLMEGLL